MSHDSSAPLIAVMGCTGTVGAEVMRQLATQPCAVRGIVRQPPRNYPVPAQDQHTRISYAQVDHASEDQLARGMAGADALFLLIGTHPAQVQSETRAIWAAQRAGVRRIVKLSAPLVAAPAHVEVANWHREIEAALAASGLEHCSLQPYAFMQNWLRNSVPIAHFGTITGSAGDAPRNYVDCRDVAEIAVQLLLSSQPPAKAALSITGPEAISNQQIADRIGFVTGTAVRYQNLSRTEHERMLVTQARLPRWLAQHIVELEALAVQIPEPTVSTVPALLGRYPRTMDEFLLEHRAAFTRKRVLSTIRNVFTHT